MPLHKIRIIRPSWINYRFYVLGLLRVHVLVSLRDPHCLRNYLRWWVHFLWLLLGLILDVIDIIDEGLRMH